MKRILVILGMLLLVGPACSAPGQPTEAPAIEAAAPEPVQPTAAPAIEVAASEPAILSEIENDVAVRAKNEADWKTVSTVELVSDGGSVRTQADSTARLDLPNGNVLLIGPDTIFELSNFDGQNWAIFLEQGGVILEVTADHLGKSLIATPMGIAWPTGSVVGITWAPVAGLTLGTEYNMNIGCFKGSCAAAAFEEGGRLSYTSGERTFLLKGQMFETDHQVNPIVLKEKEQITFEEKTESEATVSKIIAMHDFPGVAWVRNFASDYAEKFLDMPPGITPEDPGNGGDAPTISQPPQCDLFQGAAFSHVYGEFLPGAPLAVNIKMPASVAWQDLDYKMKIGDVEGEACAPLEGNNTRLSCKIKLPSAYVGTYKHHLSLHQDGCEEPIYTKGPLSLPVPEPVDTSDKPKDDDQNSCDAYAPDQIACESGGGIWDLVFFSCTCP